MKIYKLNYILFFYCFLFLEFLNCQEKQSLNQNTFNLEKEVKANAGEDILMPSGSLVLLDASKSMPKSERLIYKWSFPPNFLFSKDYDFNVNDSVEYYDLNESNSSISIKNIKTQTKIIEIELPMKMKGSKFSIGLKVENQKGKTSEDVFTIKYLDPIKDLFNAGFSQDVVGNTEPYSYHEYFIDNEFSQYRKSLGIEDFSHSSRPNQIKLNTDFLSIQPINKQNLNPLQVESINKVIYDQCIALGVNDILDPNRTIPGIVNTKKIIQKNIVISDTLIISIDKTPRLKKWLNRFKSKSDTTDLKKEDKIESKIDKQKIVEITEELTDKPDSLNKRSEVFSKFSYTLKKIFWPRAWLENLEKNQLDSLNVELSEVASSKIIDDKALIVEQEIKKDPEINYIVIDTTVSIDTLFYEEIENLDLTYNLDCKNDSCASENALLEGVGQLLTWSINNSSNLIFNYYNISDHLNDNPQWVWRSSSSEFKPDATQKISPPDAMLLNNELSKSSLKINEDSTRVYLSQDISISLREVLLNQIMEDKNFTERLRERNRKAVAVIKKKPIIFAVSLATITQGVILLFRGDEDTSEDLPPTFPPI